MLVGLVLLAMMCSAGVSAGLFIYQYPLWLVLLAYPVTGTIVLLPGVLLFGWVRQHPPEPQASALLTSQSPAAPRPRSPAGSSNP